MKKLIVLTLATVFALTAPALADHRTSLVATIPVSDTSSAVSNTGIVLSYTVLKIGKVEIAPFETLSIFRTNAGGPGGKRILMLSPGISAFVPVGRFEIGVAESMKQVPLTYSPKQYTASLYVGLKL